MSESTTWTAGCVRVQPETAHTSLVACPSRRVFRVDIPGPELTQWIGLMDGTRTREQIKERAPEPVATADKLWNLLRDEGCLVSAAAGDPTLARLLPQDLHPERPDGYSLVWVGSQSLTEEFARACTDAGLHATYEPSELARIEQPAASGFEEQFDDQGRRIVWCLIHQDRPGKEIVDADDELEKAGAVRLHVRVVGDRIFAGPALSPSFGPTMADVFRRREAAAAAPVAFDLDHGQAPPSPIEGAVRPAEWRWASSYLAVQVERWLLGAARAEIASAELELDCVHLTVGHHGVLAMPDQLDRKRPRRIPSAWHLRDPETGVINSVSAVDGPDYFPRRLHMATARGADMRRVMDMANDLAGFGTSWEDTAAAEGPAIGEFIERYCANWKSPEAQTQWGSFRQLSARGVGAVAPANLVGYSSAQLSLPGFPFARFDADTQLTWVQGRGLLSGEARWVPACWVYVSWNQMKPATEPRLLYPNLSGIAAGRSFAEATLNGLEETVERDASMVWWANRPQLTRLPVGPLADDLVGDVGDRYDFAVIEISRQFGLSTIAACARDRENRFFTIGFASRADLRGAARKALAETFTLQRTCLTMDRAVPGSEAARGMVSLKNLKPHRVDRAYLDSYRPDFRDVKDLACQLQIYLDPRAGDRVASWTVDLPVEVTPSIPRSRVGSDTGAHESGAADPDVTALAGRIAEVTGEEPVVVDLTTPDIAEAGFTAVRVLSPGLAPNFPAAFPQWGCGRIQLAAVQHGWRTEPLPESSLNIFPMAHF